MLTDAKVAELLEITDPREAEAIVASLYARFKEPIERTIARAMAPQATAERRPFQRGLVDAAALPDAGEIVRLWPGVYPGKLTYCLGQTSAGKSTLWYNWALAGVRNWELWNVKFGLGRPLTGMYVDPENAGSWEAGIGGVCARKVKRISPDYVPPDSLFFHDGEGVDLSRDADMADLEALIVERHLDFVILDPIINLFETEDENSNAEGARQFKRLKLLARTTGAAIIAVHHLGSDLTSVTGRGATSRAGHADVNLIVRLKSAHASEEHNDDYEAAGGHDRVGDLIRFQCVKNRIEGRFSLFLRTLGGDLLERVTFDDWRAAKDNAAGQPPSRKEAAMNELYLLLAGQDWTPEKAVAEMLQAEGYSQVTAKAAVAAAVRDSVLRSRPTQDGKASEVRLSRTGDADTTSPTKPGKADSGSRLPYADKENLHANTGIDIDQWHAYAPGPH